jgi:hypothetical protein
MRRNRIRCTGWFAFPSALPSQSCAVSLNDARSSEGNQQHKPHLFNEPGAVFYDSSDKRPK